MFDRFRNIKKEYDIIIIGGGIYGATLLWEATLNNLSAILVEKNDFCSATSANSLKIIHGGLRYLQNFDLKRIRESSRELQVFINILPNLIHALPCVIPTYPRLKRSKLAFRLALRLYDLISFHGNAEFGFENEIPLGNVISLEEYRRLIESLDLPGISGGALWYDALNYNSERSALAFIFSSIHRGADAFNYLELKNLIVRNNRAIGIKAHDNLLGQDIEVFGKTIVNATGPWINTVNRHMSVDWKKSQFYFTKAVNLVIDRFFSDFAFGLQINRSIDDINESDRYLFFVPWRGATMIGTWYFSHRSSPDDLSLTEKELNDCINQIKNIFPDTDIAKDSVCFVHAGLVPVVQRPNMKSFELKGRHSLIDHSLHGGPDGVISVLGVKYTTARSEAVETIKYVSQKLGKDINSIKFKISPLIGGDIKSFDNFLQTKRKNNKHNLSNKTIKHLSLNYGTIYNNIVDLISDSDELGELIPGSDEAIKAELRYCIKNEFAYKLPDLILRRTDIGTLKKPSDETINFCADFMGKEIGWSDSEKKDQKNLLIEIYSRFPQN